MYLSPTSLFLQFFLYTSLIDAEPIFVYHSMSEEALVEVNAGVGMAFTRGTIPKKEDISTAVNIHMESFFDGADAIC